MNVALPAKAAARPPITVNGVVISRAAIAREAQHHPAASPGESIRKASEALVLRELLLQEARRQARPAEPRVDEAGRRETEEEALIRDLIEREVKVPAPAADELRRYYASNPSRFRTDELVEARHILIAARATDAAAYAAARARAEAVVAALAADPDRFTDLARAHSDCTSAGEGGVLGQLAPGETTPEFAAALAELSDGETTSAPVATRYGFHIIRLDRRISGSVLPFDTVSARIAEYLTERARRIATAQYLARLVSRAAIAGIEIKGAEAHRVN